MTNFSAKSRVILAESTYMHRAFLEMQIRASANYELLTAVKCAAEAEVLCAALNPDLVLLDALSLTGGSGLNAAAHIKSSFPGIKVILITALPEMHLLDWARKAGADSFWYKETSVESLFSVMDRTMAGGSVYPNATPDVPVGLASSKEFTRRELEVLTLLANGSSNQEIAKALCISVNAVHHHVNNMLKKTGFSSRVKLAATVSRLGLILDPAECDAT